MDDFSSTYFSSLKRFLRSNDRFRRVRAMSILSKLTTLEENEFIITKDLPMEVYEAVLGMLAIPDISLILSALDLLYFLSDLNEDTATNIAKVHAGIDTLVCLVTVRAESYGNRAIAGFRIVENKHSMFTMKNQAMLRAQPEKGAVHPQARQHPPKPSTPQVLPRPTTPIELAQQRPPKLPLRPIPSRPVFAPPPGPATPVNMQPLMPSQPLMPVQPVPPPPAPSALTPNRPPGPEQVPNVNNEPLVEMDAEMFAAHWMSAFYEPNAKGATVLLSAVYADYMQTCQMVKREGVLPPKVFHDVLRTVLPPHLAQIVPSEMEGMPNVRGVQRRETPMPVHSRLPKSIAEQILRNKPPGGLANYRPPASSTPTKSKSKKADSIKNNLSQKNTPRKKSSKKSASKMVAGTPVPLSVLAGNGPEVVNEESCDSTMTSVSSIESHDLDTRPAQHFPPPAPQVASLLNSVNVSSTSLPASTTLTSTGPATTTPISIVTNGLPAQTNPSSVPSSGLTMQSHVQNLPALDIAKLNSGSLPQTTSECYLVIEQLKREMQSHFAQFHVHRQHIQAIQAQVQQIMTQSNIEQVPAGVIREIQQRVEAHHQQMQMHYQKLQQLTVLSEKVQKHIMSKQTPDASVVSPKPLSIPPSSPSVNSATASAEPVTTAASPSMPPLAPVQSIRSPLPQFASQTSAFKPPQPHTPQSPMHPLQYGQPQQFFPGNVSKPMADPTKQNPAFVQPAFLGVMSQSPLMYIQQQQLQGVPHLPSPGFLSPQSPSAFTTPGKTPGKGSKASKSSKKKSKNTDSPKTGRASKTGDSPKSEGSKAKKKSRTKSSKDKKNVPDVVSAQRSVPSQMWLPPGGMNPAAAMNPAIVAFLQANMNSMGIAGMNAAAINGMNTGLVGPNGFPASLGVQPSSIVQSPGTPSYAPNSFMAMLEGDAPVPSVAASASSYVRLSTASTPAIPVTTSLNSESVPAVMSLPKVNESHVPSIVLSSSNSVPNTRIPSARPETPISAEVEDVLSSLVSQAANVLHNNETDSAQRNTQTSVTASSSCSENSAVITLASSDCFPVASVTTCSTSHTSLTSSNSVDTISSDLVFTTPTATSGTHSSLTGASKVNSEPLMFTDSVNVGHDINLPDRLSCSTMSSLSAVTSNSLRSVSVLDVHKNSSLDSECGPVLSSSACDTANNLTSSVLTASTGRSSSAACDLSSSPSAVIPSNPASVISCGSHTLTSFSPLFNSCTTSSSSLTSPVSVSVSSASTVAPSSVSIVSPTLSTPSLAAITSVLCSSSALLSVRSTTPCESVASIPSQVRLPVSADSSLGSTDLVLSQKQSVSLSSAVSDTTSSVHLDGSESSAVNGSKQALNLSSSCSRETLPQSPRTISSCVTCYVLTKTTPSICEQTGPPVPHPNDPILPASTRADPTCTSSMLLSDTAPSISPATSLHLSYSHMNSNGGLVNGNRRHSSDSADSETMDYDISNPQIKEIRKRKLLEHRSNQVESTPVEPRLVNGLAGHSSDSECSLDGPPLLKKKKTSEEIQQETTVTCNGTSETISCVSASTSTTENVDSQSTVVSSTENVYSQSAVVSSTENADSQSTVVSSSDTDLNTDDQAKQMRRVNSLVLDLEKPNSELVVSTDPPIISPPVIATLTVASPTSAMPWTCKPKSPVSTGQDTASKLESTVATSSTIASSEHNDKSTVSAFATVSSPPLTSPAVTKPFVPTLPIPVLAKSEESTVKQTPLLSSGQVFGCKWRSCEVQCDTNAALLEHMIIKHAPAEGRWATCKVAGCSQSGRTRSAMLLHFQQKHCLERGKDGTVTTVPLPDLRLNPRVSTPPTSAPATSAADFSHHVRKDGPLRQEPMRDLTAEYEIAKERAEYLKLFPHEDESPVTRSVRFTSALILRNIAKRSPYGRRLIQAHEAIIAAVAMSMSEASSAAAQCLIELSERQVPMSPTKRKSDKLRDLQTETSLDKSEAAFTASSAAVETMETDR